MKTIIVEFSGWVRMDPADVKLVNIGSEQKCTITGTEWLLLDEEQRGDYILESVIDCQHDAVDGSYDDISVHVEIFPEQCLTRYAVLIQ